MGVLAYLLYRTRTVPISVNTYLNVFVIIKRKTLGNPEDRACFIVHLEGATHVLLRGETRATEVGAIQSLSLPLSSFSAQPHGNSPLFFCRWNSSGATLPSLPPGALLLLPPPHACSMNLLPFPVRIGDLVKVAAASIGGCVDAYDSKAWWSSEEIMWTLWP
jgi:hypothetical protein